MPKNKHSNKSSRHRPLYKRPMFWLFIFALIFAAVLIVNYLKIPDSPTNTSTSSTTNKEETNHSNKTKDDNLSKDSTDSEPEPSETTASPDGKTPTQYEGNNPNQSDTLTGGISTARISGDNLIIRVNVDQFVTGSCTLILSDGTNQLERTARLIASASTSTCEGFDIPMSDVSNLSHPIRLTVNLSAGDKTGTIAGDIE